MNTYEYWKSIFYKDIMRIWKISDLNRNVYLKKNYNEYVDVL